MSTKRKRHRGITKVVYTCGFDGCKNPTDKWYCLPHRVQQRMGKPMTAVTKQGNRKRSETGLCVLEGCDEPAYKTYTTCLPHRNVNFPSLDCKRAKCRNKARYGSRGFCTKHYREDLGRRNARKGLLCVTDGCEKGAVREKKYCDTHWGIKWREETGDLPWTKATKDKASMARIDGQWVSEHRVVMEEFLGRKLARNEIVSFVDGDCRNAHPDNLRLSTISMPGEYSGYFTYRAPHILARLDKALEMVETYEPLRGKLVEKVENQRMDNDK